MITWYIDVSSPRFSMPRPVDALPCGSRSMTSVRNPSSARQAPRLTVVVVLPTPPFWLATAITRGSGRPRRRIRLRSSRIDSCSRGLRRVDGPHGSGECRQGGCRELRMFHVERRAFTKGRRNCFTWNSGPLDGQSTNPLVDATSSRAGRPAAAATVAVRSVGGSLTRANPGVRAVIDVSGGRCDVAEAACRDHVEGVAALADHSDVVVEHLTFLQAQRDHRPCEQIGAGSPAVRPSSP